MNDERMKRRLEILESFLYDMKRQLEVFEKPDSQIDRGIGRYMYERVQDWDKEIERFTNTGEYIS